MSELSPEEVRLDDHMLESLMRGSPFLIQLRRRRLARLSSQTATPKQEEKAGEDVETLQDKNEAPEETETLSQAESMDVETGNEESQHVETMDAMDLPGHVTVEEEEAKVVCRDR